MISGVVRKFGDDVNTDVIMPGKYLAMRNPEQIAPYIMEGIDPDFAKEARPGDVIAASFGRIFLRNAINIGLPVLECPEAAQALADGDRVTVDVTTGAILDETSGRSFRSAPFSPVLQEIIRAGGFVPYVRRRLASTTP